MWDRDETKRQANLAKHGVDFADVYDFDWENAEHAIDTRFDYGETRIVTLGNLYGRLHAVTWTLRGDITRIINFRKANAREQKSYRIARTTH